MPKKLRVSNGFPVKHILVMFFILFLSFSINFFGVGERGWYEKYQVGSDALVFNKLACLKADHQTGWLIWREAAELNNINPVCKSDGQAYFSQIGLQGRVMAYAYKYFNFISISMAKYILLLKLLAPLFSAVTLLLFSYWVIKRFGLTEAYIVTILIANSVWIVGFSKSLFWSMPLLFLPFISTLFLAKKSKSRSRDGILFLLLTLLMMFKFASGYEYASVIIMSIVGAVVTVGIIDSYKRQRIQYLIIISIAAGLIAFTATIGLHTILINKEFNNERHSLSIIYKRFIYRTAKPEDSKKVVFDGMEYTIPNVNDIIEYYLPIDSYRETTPIVQTEFLSATNYALLPIISYPIELKEPLQTYLSSFIFSIIIFILLSAKTIKSILFRKKVKTSRANNELALFIGASVGLMGVLSWFLLARGHSYVHAHINGITYYLPYGLFLYALIAVKLGLYIKKVKVKYGNKKV